MLHDESETQTHQKISHILNGWHFRGTLQRRRKKKNISNTNSGQCDYRIEIENMHDLNGRKEGEKQSYIGINDGMIVVMPEVNK